MNKLLNEQELKVLAEMAQDFEAQMKEQSELAIKIAIECEKAIGKEQNKQKAR